MRQDELTPLLLALRFTSDNFSALPRKINCPNWNEGISLSYQKAIRAMAVGATCYNDSVGELEQSGSATAAIGTPVHMGNQLRTGPDSRLQVTFVDGTELTLGENARVVVDRYVYNPEQCTGEVALTATRAALHFTTGKLKHLRNKSIRVDTPVAALAVRGTVFWAGIIDYQYGVLLLDGKLNVSNSAGSEDISLPSHGIDFPPVLKEASSISDPYEWDAAKIQRALDTVAFAPKPFLPLIPPPLFIPDDPSSP